MMVESMQHSADEHVAGVLLCTRLCAVPNLCVSQLGILGCTPRCCLISSITMVYLSALGMIFQVPFCKLISLLSDSSTVHVSEESQPTCAESTANTSMKVW